MKYCIFSYIAIHYTGHVLYAYYTYSACILSGQCSHTVSHWTLECRLGSDYTSTLWCHWASRTVQSTGCDHHAYSTGAD